MSKIIVKSKSERGFRRAGLQFTREGVELDTTKLKKGQLEEIEAEPNLVVVPVGEKDDSVLLDSDKFPALVKIGEAEVQLGELVPAAFTRSGVESNKAWNALAAKKRDAFIQAEIDARIAALGEEKK
ncbi:MAG TPA: HI1506-related protein [Pseudoxanthomonas sp.]|nr:HI1506-related protein [Pseudoxanthomonas sp.]